MLHSTFWNHSYWQQQQQQPNKIKQKKPLSPTSWQGLLPSPGQWCCFTGLGVFGNPGGALPPTLYSITEKCSRSHKVKVSGQTCTWSKGIWPEQPGSLQLPQCGQGCKSIAYTALPPTQMQTAFVDNCVVQARFCVHCPLSPTSWQLFFHSSNLLSLRCI